jgi:hypothetical protein
MVKEIKNPESVKPPFKEKVEVRDEDGKYKGWKTEAKWAELIGIKDRTQEQKTAESLIAIIFDGDEEGEANHSRRKRRMTLV